MQDIHTRAHTLTCFWSRETHFESMEPRDRLGSMWFRTLARNTLKGVAESGFIWTMGAIRTTPAKSPGLSHAVRMEMAPP